MVLGGCALILACASRAPGQVSDWNAHSGGDWFTASNWDAGAPNGSSVTAAFNSSVNSPVTLDAPVTLSELSDNAGAPLTLSLNSLGEGLVLEGAGLAGGSTSSLSLINGNGFLSFNNYSSAASAGISNSFIIQFSDSSTAGQASLDNIGSGEIVFTGSSSAGNASLANQGTLFFQSNATTGNATLLNTNSLVFKDGSTAGSALLNNAGGSAQFVGSTSAGSATLLNSGFLYFEGSSTAAGAWVSNAGWLQFDTNATAGGAQLANQAGATLVFMDSSTAGSASLANNGLVFFTASSTAGTAALTSNNWITFQDSSTAGSATILDNSALFFRNTSTAGNASITVTAGNGVEFDDTATAGGAQIGAAGGFFFRGNSSGGDAVLLNTGGSLFTDSSTAANALIANSGALTFNSIATAGAASITNGGVLEFDGFSNAGQAFVSNSANLNFNNNASTASATVENLGGGVILFSNMSTAGSATITNAANAGIGFNNQSTAGNATLLNQGGGFLFFNNGSGAGSATIVNQGNMAFGGDSPTTFAGAGFADITNRGVVYFNNYSSAQNAVLDTESGGTLYFTGNAMGGLAQVTVNGTGVLDISGAAHNVIIGSLAGSGFVSLGGKNLVLNVPANESTQFSGEICDGGASGGVSGTLDLTGPGALTLSGTNTYTGGTYIENGILTAANPYAFGTGYVEIDSGTLALGGPLTLHLGGNFVQSLGTLQLGLDPGTGQSDLLQITGTANLAGPLTLVSYTGLGTHLNESVTILDSSFLTGAFSLVADEVPDSSASLVYGSSNVVLDLATTAPFASLGTTPNQISVGKGLDGLGAQSPRSPLVLYLNGQPDAALPGLYDQLSPANLTPLYQMGFSTAQAEAGLVGSRVARLFGDMGLNSDDISWNGQGPMFAGNLPAPQEASMSKDLQAQRWGVFVNALDDFGTVNGDGNGPGYQYSTGGMAAGLDYCFSKDLVVGLLLGYSSSGTSQSTGTVNSTGGQAGLYAGWKQGSLHMEALVAGGVNNYTTQRQALGGTASGSTQGTQFSGQLGAGYDLKAGNVKIQPFVSGQYANVSFNDFTETGSAAPLSYGSQSEGHLSSDLGAAASRKWNLKDITLSPSVDVAWEHVYQGNIDGLSASFSGNGNFTVNGPAMGTDAAVLGAGVNALFAKGLNAYVNYQAKVGLANGAEQNVSAGVNLGF